MYVGILNCISRKPKLKNCHYPNDWFYKLLFAKSYLATCGTNIIFHLYTIAFDCSIKCLNLIEKALNKNAFSSFLYEIKYTEPCFNLILICHRDSLHFTVKLNDIKCIEES